MQGRFKYSTVTEAMFKLKKGQLLFSLRVISCQKCYGSQNVMNLCNGIAKHMLVGEILYMDVINKQF